MISNYHFLGNDDAAEGRASFLINERTFSTAIASVESEVYRCLSMLTRRTVGASQCLAEDARLMECDRLLTWKIKLIVSGR